MAAPNSGPKERAGQDRRRELLEVAARLFAERGFHGTSMDDIAREMGILKGSLYYWIDSKEALLGEVLEGSIRETIAEATRIADSEVPASERLRQMVRCHIKDWVRNPHNFNVFMSEWRWLDPTGREAYRREKNELEDTYKRVVHDGIQSGEFGITEDQVSIVVNGILGTVNWFPRWYRPDGKATHEEIADILATLLIEGLRSRRS